MKHSHVILLVLVGAIFLTILNNYHTIATSSRSKEEEESYGFSILNHPKNNEPTTTTSTLSTTTTTKTCHSFFSIMSSSYMDFEEYDDKPCIRFYETRYKPLLEFQQEFMERMNSTLTIYTSWSIHQVHNFTSCQQYLNDNTTTNKYPNLIEKRFDPTSLLIQNNFTSKEIDWLRHWDRTNPTNKARYVHKKHVAARLSDVFRILLAKGNDDDEGTMAYLDLDMFPIYQKKNMYLQSPNVAVPFWSDIANGGLEIQNSGFCFTTKQLDYLIIQMKSIINSKGNEQNYELYTELGPTLFQKSIQTLSSLAHTRLLFTTTNSDSSSQKVITKLNSSVSYYWLHLDGQFRGPNSSHGTDQLRNAMKQVFQYAITKINNNK